MCNEYSKKPIDLKIQEFDIKKLRDDSVIVIIDQKKTGKSFLTKNILYNKKTIPVGIVISGTESNTNSYSEIIPPTFIHKEYTPKIIDNVIKRQKLVLKKLRNNKEIDSRSFLILDDCLYDNKWQEDQNMRLCFTTGRNLRLLVILAMQSPIMIAPHIRTNTDYIFMFYTNIKSEQRRLYDYYGGIFPTFEMFCKTFNKFTGNHTCLVIDNNSRSDRIEDTIFWYKVDKTPDFNIGVTPIS